MSVAINTQQQRPFLQDFIVQFRSPFRTFHVNPDDACPECFFDAIEDKPNYYYMTAQGPRVRLGELIEIEQSGQYLTYQVHDIEYYSQPSDMWMAVLHKTNR